MRRKKIKVSAVSYLNTIPFLHGIENSEVKNLIDLSLDIPSDCAKKLLLGQVDLGLVPVAVLSQLKEYHIVSDFCIGAVGNVQSVALYSDVPLPEITTIYLDYQSRTSVNLAKVLAKEFWNISPEWLESSEGYEQKIEGNTGGVIIGDRTFNLAKTYNYKYDLAGEWFSYSGLPFVFACWVSSIKLPASFIQQFNACLKFGVDNINAVVANHKEGSISKENLNSYLIDNISYELDSQKKIALARFLGSIKTTELIRSNS
jgi:chorismate dehydratase